MMMKKFIQDIKIHETPIPSSCKFLVTLAENLLLHNTFRATSSTRKQSIFPRHKHTYEERFTLRIKKILLILKCTI